MQKFERAGKEVVPSSMNTVIEEGLKPHVYSFDKAFVKIIETYSGTKF